MWRTIKYVVQISGYGAAVISLLFFGGSALLAIADTNAGGFIGFVKYLAISSAFLSSVLVASALKPEDLSAIEMYNTLPHPFWRIIARHIIVNLLAILLSVILVTLITLAIMGDIHYSALPFLGIANVVSNSLLFGGFSLLGTVLGRDSRIGQLLGLLMFALSLVVPFPEFISPAVYPYRVMDGLSFSIAWWSSRLGYAILGTLVCALSLYLAQDTDRLMVGKHSQSTSVSSDGKFSIWRKRETIISPSKTLRIPPSRFLGLVAYEALLAAIGGVIPILVLGMCAMFTCVLPLFDAIHGGIHELLSSQVNSPVALIYFLFPLLPVILVDSIPHDRRALLDQLILTTISPRAYLGGKALGACVTILGAFLLGNVPVLFLLTIAALIGSFHFLLCYLSILLLGVLPALVYFSVMSVLVGTLARSQRPVFLGGLMTIGSIVLLIATHNSIVGNMLFPTGLMATDTLLAWMRQQTGIIYSSINPAQTVVPLFYLVFPPLSAILQIGLVWFLVGRAFDKEITTA